MNPAPDGPSPTRASNMNARGRIHAAPLATQQGRVHQVATGARLSEYATIGGVCLPTRGEVRLELAKGRYTYWGRTITSVEPGACDGRP